MNLISNKEVFDTSDLRIGSLYRVTAVPDGDEIICMLSNFTLDELTFLYAGDDKYTAVYNFHISKAHHYKIEEYMNFYYWFNRVINKK